MKTLLVACFICVAFLSASTEAATISGDFNDVSNPALLSSRGFGDLGVAKFGDEDAVARNVAIYSLDILTPATVEFRSSGYAAGGAQPYLSIFSGSTAAAIFVDSSYYDLNIDFDVMELLAAGEYLVAVGVYENESFAENLGTGTLADGFTALGVPEYVGNAFYNVDVTSSAILSIAPAPLLGTPPTSNGVPEPSVLALLGAGLVASCARRKAA